MNFSLRFRCAAAVFIVVVSLLLACNGGKSPVKSSPETEDSRVRQIDTLIKSYAALEQFSGAVLVADRGEILYKGAFGKSNLEWDIPNTVETRFRVASVTKQFVAMQVMQLVEKGVLKLDGKVTDYLPDYPKKTGDKITIYNLLTHSSGIPEYSDSFWEAPDAGSRHHYTPVQLLHISSGLALQFEPGTNFSYCNPGYILLGVIIEKVTGKPWEQTLKEQIFDPAGMKHSSIDNGLTVIPNRSGTYQRDLFDGFRVATYQDMSTAYTAGGLCTTVEDLFLWDKALHAHTLLSEEMTKKYLTPRFKLNFLPFGLPVDTPFYAFGWMASKLLPAAIGNSDSLDIQLHTGTLSGVNALVIRIPQKKQFITLLNNTGVGRNKLLEIASSVIRILYGKPFEFPRSPVADEMVKIIKIKGVPAAVQFHNEAKRSRAGNYEFNPEKLFAIGSRLMNDGNASGAAAIFEMMLAQYPQPVYSGELSAYHVHAALGSAYVMLNQHEAARKAFEESNRLNPNHSLTDKEYYDKNIQQLKSLKKRKV